jgi:ERCC4-related helicase
MMMPIVESLSLSAKQWQFLSNPWKYVEASKKTDRELSLESTQRQFLTARDILARLGGCCGEKARKGILLADDVGLGKTTVAALVAWVFASAGEKGNVRILAPNDVMVRRWEEELKSHVELLKCCAPYLVGVDAKRVKGAVKRLHPGSIQVVKHSYASGNNGSKGNNLECDLLIIDEAHRAKGDGTNFSKSLKRQKQRAKRILILTATPFSIQLAELERMLTLVGAEHVALSAVKKYRSELDRLYTGGTAHNPEEAVKRLAASATMAIEAIRHYVIRHSIDDLPKEQKALGTSEDWGITVPSATQEEQELLLRMDRMKRVAKQGAKHEITELTGATNDPRFHVGWHHFDYETQEMRKKEATLREPVKALVEKQRHEITRLRGKVGIHPKIVAVAEKVDEAIEQGEKVVIFCHHHATAKELTMELASLLPKPASSKLDGKFWKEAWEQVLKPPGEERHAGTLRNTFIEWLCSDLIRSQTESWLGITPKSVASLRKALETKHARRHHRAETIQQAAQRLYHELLNSRSSKAVLWQAADRLELLPGANGAFRVLGICEHDGSDEERGLFIHNRQPDTAISIFGSPFGPDVLVVTDKLSEGIDLHRYCRHLIHYELDPSPIRTVQRNGRIRRVNSWAAITKQKICYAYPAFGGTRDEKLVSIMKKRLSTFSLLLGGVQDFDLDSTNSHDENWRGEVVEAAKKQLKSDGGKLRAKEPGTE